MRKEFGGIILLALLTSSFLSGQERADTIKVKALTQNPHGSISIACDACHATGEWKSTRKDMAFDHNTQTDFPLEGQHKAGDCKACHANYQFTGSRTECYQCHNDIHKGQLGKQCDQCHTSKSWEPFNFKVQHDLTRFPLTGKHATTDCQSCHRNQQQNEFKGLSILCSSCHMSDYKSASNPNHVQYNIPITCETCHTPQGWSPALIIDHTQFGFSLTQGHANLACAACHGTGNYKVTGECYTCHKNDYDLSNDPKHLSGHYSNNCLNCHTAAPGWTPAQFDHTVSNFPLTGAHLSAQNQCASCHPSGFMNTAKACYSCHSHDFTQTTNPNHISGNFSQNCEDCHTTNPNWKPATFGHNASQFPLTGGHLLVQDQCQKCHASGYNNTPLLCYSCHQENYNNSTNPNHVAGNFSTNCEQCHTTSPGWKPASFDHSATSFQLTGAHLAIQNQCMQCHTSGFVNTPTACYSCHQSDYNNSANPAHQALAFPTNCDQCHTTQIGWKPSTFDHSTTQFQLTGAHVAVADQCSQCHTTSLSGTGTACYSCHQSDYNNSGDPNHQALMFPTNCDQCHTTNPGWKPSTFDHNATPFQLTGAHLAVAGQCAQCHTTGVSGTNPDCYACHQQDFASTVNPNHVTGNYSTHCNVCHTTNPGWQPVVYDHNLTSFPLTGAHQTIKDQCNSCHTGGYINTPSTCYACHQTAYNNSANPAHQALAFPTNCDQCHTTNIGWKPSTFDHSTTPFQLTGAHLFVAGQCSQCHTTSLSGTSTACYSCHQTDYTTAIAPNHLTSAFPTDCQQCHTTNSGWKPSTFDHNTTQFQLTGAHITVAGQCSQCHTTSLSGTSTACYSCHQSDYNNSDNPNHQSLIFPTNCEQCHTTQAGWKPSTFDHSTTPFQLTGAHLSVAGQCSQCHITSLSGTSTACYSCHQSDYNNSNNPNHQALAFPTNCEQCHTTQTGWKPSTFDHSTTPFQLTGAHLSVASQCSQCHTTSLSGTSMACYSCHQTDYNNSANPAHQALAFPTNCDQCHTTQIGWKPSTFNHSTTQFQLTGAHIAVANQCSQCHTTSLSGTSTACYSCHQTDYNISVNPGHQALAFPTNCDQCHTTQAGWKPSTFDHSTTQFQLTGAHVVVANQCSQCHTTSLSGTSTACYSCHQSDYNTTANPSHLTPAFPTNCEQCHTTNTGWKPSTFDHNATQFQLTGAHSTIAGQCSQCHITSLIGTSTACYSCHQSNYSNTTNPNHAANAFPTDCSICHTTISGWTPVTFDHSASGFPLTGAHLTIAGQCVSCHSGGYVNTPTNCYACHQSDYNSAANPNHASNNIPTNCEQCHSTNSGWVPSTFDHSATAFPLTGAHLAVGNQCIACHSTGFVNTPTDCFACHQTDYNQAGTPDHPGLSFPTTCSSGCHSTTGWTPSTFNHTTYTTYTLAGAHQAIAGQCSKCHTGNLVSADRACYSCHQTDYNNSTNPNHAGSGFSQDCQNCHGQTVWIPWTVNHDAVYFPINSGRHNGIWTGCGGGSGDGAGCHTSNTDFRIYSCIHCHEHNATATNGHHTEVPDYTYSSAACYHCHPQGIAGTGKTRKRSQ